MEKNNPQPPKLNITMMMLVLFSGFIFLNLMMNSVEEATKIDSVKFQELVDKKLIKGSVVIYDNKKVTGYYINEYQKDTTDIKSKKIPFVFQTNLNADKSLLETLNKNKIPYYSKDSPNYGGIISLIFPFLILFIVFIWLRKGMTGGMNGLKNFSSGSHKMYNPDQENKVTFKDVAGIEEAKQEVSELVDFLKDPKKYTTLGGKIPKGVLLVGPPGTGKTLLAKAIANEAKVPYFYTSGSQFIEVFVGNGARKVRDLFGQAKKNAPCIVFIDEIDTVGAKRSGMATGGHSESEQTLNQLLAEMDGFESNEGVIVLAATNRTEILDPALKRPGRFNREVHVNPPSLKGRVDILKVHTEQVRQVPLAEDVNLETIARGTTGFTGAELENIVNEAALLAGRQNKKEVSMSDFEEAIDKTLMGLENRNLTISDTEKKKTAYHEAGHTLISMLSKELDPVHKVSIVPRGRALGVTQSLPEEESALNYSKTKCVEMLEMLMGGRIAEEIFYDEEKTTGASNDIEKATQIAKNMVYSWGMSEKMGFLNYNSMPQHQFDNKHSFSESTRSEADKEVRDIIESAYKSSRKKLEDNKEKLTQIAEMLMEKETITSTDLKIIMN